MKKPVLLVAVTALTLAMVIKMFCCNYGLASDSEMAKYAKNTPLMDPRVYFNGKVDSAGVFIERSGVADPYFHIAMEGKWKDGEGDVFEEFVYSDGRRNARTWHVKFTDETHFIATAPDVVGEGRGVISGNAMHMAYVLRVPVKGRTYDLALSDWMWRVDEHTVLNKIEMRKFGFKVGELICTFRKQDA
jgi:hypothetical protein